MNPRAFFAAEEILQHGHVLHREGDQNLPRQQGGRAGVEPVQPASQDFRVLQPLGVIEEHEIAADQPPVADEQHFHACEMGFAVNGQHVLVGLGAGRQHQLLFHGAPYRADGVAQPGGVLVALLPGAFGHLALHPGHQLLVPPLEEHAHLLDDAPVILSGHGAAAGRQAFAELKIDAGTVAARAVQLHLAGAQLEVAADGVEGFAGILDRGVRTEVFGVLVELLPGQVKPGIGLVHGQLEERIGLVVLVVDVVAGLVLLDQVGFEDQRLGLAPGMEHLHVRHLVHHGRDAGGVDRGGLEIRTHAAAQALGLADVQHPGGLVLVQVHARGVGQGLQQPIQLAFHLGFFVRADFPSLAAKKNPDLRGLAPYGGVINRLTFQRHRVASIRWGR